MVKIRALWLRVPSISPNAILIPSVLSVQGGGWGYWRSRPTFFGESALSHRALNGMRRWEVPLLHGRRSLAVTSLRREY
jgi:hypothetical protein